MDQSSDNDQPPQTSCAGCQGVFEASTMSDVGNHLFCKACFDNLLEPKEEPKPATTSAAPTTGHLTVEPAPAEPGCLLCSAPMPNGPAARIGTLGLCQSCHEGLTLDPPEETSEPTEPTSPEEDAPPAGPHYTPGSTTTHCTGCGRPMPGPGSFTEQGGGAYCPECVYSGKATTEATSVAEAPLASPAPSPVASAERPNGCESCMRAFTQTNLEPTEGFWLCVACSSSNPKLALAIARARHSKKLESIAHELVE